MTRNALIDGWRGLSVTLVIVGHLFGFRFHDKFEVRVFKSVFANGLPDWQEIVSQIALRFIASLPAAGVKVFFIISGFLITSLLLKETSERQEVSISAFYVRRACRILPAFIVYLATIYALARSGVISVPIESFVWSGSFLCNVPEANCTWWLAHTWSLSVEEQYYLAWPALFIFLGKWRSHGMALVLVALLAASPLFPLSLSFAYIAIGSLYALSSTTRRVVDRLGTGKLIVVFTALILSLPLFASFDIVHKIMKAAQPVMLAAVFFGTLNGQGMFVPIVRSEWLRRFGVVSYSVYLWQQLFTGNPGLHDDQVLLNIPALFIPAALLSYFLVEKAIHKTGTSPLR